MYDADSIGSFSHVGLLHLYDEEFHSISCLWYNPFLPVNASLWSVEVGAEEVP